MFDTISLSLHKVGYCDLVQQEVTLVRLVHMKLKRYQAYESYDIESSLKADIVSIYPKVGHSNLYL